MSYSIDTLCGMSPRGVPESRIQEMRTHADLKGGRLVSESWENSKYKYRWECSRGHAWSATWASVGTLGTWCPICAGQTPRSIEELRKTAEERGGRLLTSEYGGTENFKYEFECSLGHRFENRFRHIVDRNQWCPICSKGSKSEEVARTHFEQIFGMPFPRVKPKWLRNSRNFVMEIDGYCEALQIGFEYQGAQHYRESHFQTNLEQRIADDADKARICADKGVKLFILTYEMPYSDFSAEIKKQAIAFGVDINLYDFDIQIDLNQAFIRDDRLLELKELLSQKQITVLSTKWLGVAFDYEFKCDVCGHEWKSQANHYFNSRRVGGCKKCAMKVLRDNHRGDILDLASFASQYGGEVISTEYTQRNAEYQFKCVNGHEFSGNFNNMAFRDEFCPICENRITREVHDTDSARRIFLERGLRTIGEFPGSRKDWECECTKCGNQFARKLESVKSGGVACPYCAGTLTDPKKAELLLRKSGLTPLEPFPGTSKKWKSRCDKCGSVNSPIYSNIQKGQGGCRNCYLKRVAKS